MRSPRTLFAAPVATAALLLAACGGPEPLAPSPYSQPTQPVTVAAATPTPHPVVLVVLGDARTLLFLRPDGTTLGEATAPPQLAYQTPAAGAVWYVDTDAHLRTVAPDGTRSDRGALPGLGGTRTTLWGLAVSTDGSGWAWGVCACTGSGARTQIWVGGTGTPARVVLDEPTTNQVLIPTAWTARGLVVARSASGFGGCCYLMPETGRKDSLLVDPATGRVIQTWNGCAAAYASPSGSVACAGTTITVHRADGSTRTVTPIPPVVSTGWAHVDDAGRRVVFTVIHTRTQGGDGSCPCTLDIEAGDLDTGAVATVVDQMTLDDVLPGGAIVARAAPVTPGQGTVVEMVVGTDRSRVQLGPANAEYVGAF